MEKVAQYAGMVVNPQTPNQEWASRAVGVALTAGLFAKMLPVVAGRRMPGTLLKAGVVTLPPAATLAARELGRAILERYNAPQPDAGPSAEDKRDSEDPRDFKAHVDDVQKEFASLKAYSAMAKGIDEEWQGKLAVASQAVNDLSLPEGGRFFSGWASRVSIPEQTTDA